MAEPIPWHHQESEPRIEPADPSTRPEESPASRLRTTARHLGQIFIESISSYPTPQEVDDTYEETEQFQSEMSEAMPIEVEGGYSYEARVLNRQYLGEVRPLVVFNALSLRSEAGYMRYRLNDFTQNIEQPVVNISSEGFDGNFLDDDQIEQLTFSRIATNMHLALDQLELQFLRKTGQVLSVSDIDVSGDSRGAMTGLEFAAQAKYFGREIQRCALIAPCGPAHASLSHALRYGRQFLLEEPTEILRHIAQTKPGARLHRLNQLLPTVLIPKSAMSPVIKTAMEALKGPMDGIGERLPESTRFEILLFTSDTVSFYKRWVDMLAGLDNVSLHTKVGGHLGIIDTDSVDFVAEALNRDRY